VDSYLHAGTATTLADDVLDGLTRPFKELPGKHLYDARGSQLFEQICSLSEYYPTRSERALLTAEATEIIAATLPNDLIELGAGSPAKARILLNAMHARDLTARYVPLDVSPTAVLECAREVADAFPTLDVHGVVGDIDHHLACIPDGGTRLVACLGGTFGNFLPGSRRRFLRHVRPLLAPDDHLLLGCDLVKDPVMIEAAYNDSRGVTAEFNRNVLEVLNRELDGNFELANFEHRAFYDAERDWIEMRLRARTACQVRLGAIDLGISFRSGEEVRTEISARFTRTSMAADLHATGLELVGWYTDPAKWSALAIARPRSAAPRRPGVAASDNGRELRANDGPSPSS